MASSLTIFDEPHHQSLELLCARALASGDIATAYKLSDRRCRIPPLPEPHCYVLRGEALFRMGEKAAAVADIAKALEIAPDDVGANRRMLAWGNEHQRRAAAASLITHERDFDVLRRAIAALRHRKRRAFANLMVLDDAVHGWAAWDGEGPVSISIADDADTVTTVLEGDPRHPLSSEFGRAVSIDLARPKPRGAQTISISTDDAVIFLTRPPRTDEELNPAAQRKSAVVNSNRQVTVIVPVYADYKATKACLDSLLAQPKGSPNHHVIVVNDATPEPRIAQYLARIERTPGLQLLTNPSNLGFVGTVNRALDHAGGGDIVLLNADTVVPAGFVERLAAAAYASPDIGTLTPLSNNGEFTSFPVANRANPPESAAQIAAIDRVAAEVNAGRVVDIPNGIGFCLYITRACLDAVPFLSEHYHRGYLEDVDFCLRAREHGFRNVCATGVYVGHAGSRSFGDEKRSLVVRNLAVIERRFPNYRAECAAFVMADSLRESRAAIERAIAPGAVRPRLLIAGAGAVGEVVRARAQSLTAAKEHPPVILELQHRAWGVTAKIIDANGRVPQSVSFELASDDDRAALMAYLRQLRPSRLEFADPANTPEPVVQDLLGLKTPYDMLVADGGLLGTRATHLAGESTNTETSRQFWRKIAKGAAHILVPCAQAEAFAANALPRRDVVRLPGFSVKRKAAEGKKTQRSCAAGDHTSAANPTRPRHDP